MTDTIPNAAWDLLPAVMVEAEELVPMVKDVQLFAAQIEQESCVTLKSKGCWNPRVELKTKREYGFGLGQITIAYRADGSERFNSFQEIRALDQKLKHWQWENRFDSQMQVRAIMVKNRQVYKSVTYNVQTIDDAAAMMFAGYNGGIGGVLADRKLCQATANCNPNLWWGNVEKTSGKSRVKWQGYGKSAFDINREYPYMIMRVRQDKYRQIFDQLTPLAK